MHFNRHLELEGLHASLLSPSKPSWLDYDEDKLSRVFHTTRAAQRGTELHKLANDLIRLKVPLEDKPLTLNMFVNDALGFNLSPEQPLFYSVNCFGTADALGFRHDTLRVSDLKTGSIPAKPRQLQIYAALFCLEYGFKPFDIGYELRIYQNDRVTLYETDPIDISIIMDRIIIFDKYIDELRKE